MDGSEVTYEEDLGNIFVPKNPQTVAQEIMPDLWAQEVRPKLDGRARLSRGEEIFEIVKVIPSGDSWDELIRMKETGTSVNIRDYPGKYYINGEPVKILGVVNQGTTIKRVLGESFNAFKFADLEGPLLDQKGHPVNLPPDKICAICWDYLA